MAGRRRSKTFLDEGREFQSSSDDEPKDVSGGNERRRTLSVSRSGRFKEQKRRGVLSESVFDSPPPAGGSDRQPEGNTAVDAGAGKDPPGDKSPTSTAKQTEKNSAEKMTVVFETKL